LYSGVFVLFHSGVNWQVQGAEHQRAVLWVCTSSMQFGCICTYSTPVYAEPLGETDLTYVCKQYAWQSARESCAASERFFFISLYCRKCCALVLVVWFFPCLPLSDLICPKIFLLYVHCLLENSHLSPALCCPFHLIPMLPGCVVVFLLCCFGTALLIASDTLECASAEHGELPCHTS